MRLASFRSFGLGFLVSWLVVGCVQNPAPPSSIVTFNIENFPKNPRQVQGAFQVIRELGAPVVGVQEITDPLAFRMGAHRYLGESWEFVTHEDPPGSHRVGLLYDARVYTMTHARAHDGVRVLPRGRPALEVRLVDTVGQPLRVIVVHLKAGRGYVDVRRRQLDALEQVVAAARATDEETWLLGDFNTTTAADRTRLASLAEAESLAWPSRTLPCTSLHRGPRGCRGSALDHVLSTEPTLAQVKGPCAEGCSPGERCPTFVYTVSDHCPVMATDLR